MAQALTIVLSHKKVNNLLLHHEANSQTHQSYTKSTNITSVNLTQHQEKKNCHQMLLNEGRGL